MRFAAIAVLAAAVSADEAKEEWAPSAMVTLDFASDNADETAALAYQTRMVGDAKSLAGAVTITSKAKDLNQFRYTANMKQLEADPKCFERYTVISGNVGGDETYPTAQVRPAATNQDNCNDANQIQSLINQGDANNGGAFNQLDKEYMTTSAKRTVKRANGVPAVAVTEWSRPLAESAEKAWGALTTDGAFVVALAWRADD